MTMTIKIFRPTKDGTHTFSRNRSIDPFNTSTYKEITPIGEEQLRNFSNNIYDFVTEEDKTRIFFLAEYIKRQFYLDCNVEKDEDGKYSQIQEGKGKKYKIRKFEDVKSVRDAISNMFIIDKGRKTAFSYQCKIYNNFYSDISCKNIYEYLYCLYNKSIECLINILKYPNEKLINSLHDSEKQLILDFSKYNHSIYEYERILYYISSSPFFMTDCLHSTKLNAIIRYIKNINFIFDSHASYIFKNIIDRYHLYLCDLFDMTNMENIIFNNYKLENLPYFFFLPKELPINEKIDDIINCVLNSHAGTLDISVNLKEENFDTFEIAKHIYEQVILSLFAYKEDMNKLYTRSEAQNFCKYIDTSSKKK